MKKIATSIVSALILFITSTTAMAQVGVTDFNKNSCNGDPCHLYADLDSGHAVLLHFYMPNCGSCPPPARVLQKMAMNINDSHPDLVKGYAFPFNNTTTCTYSSSWVTSNGLSFYTPMDSGADQVANYGGFGMPTVVLLGGRDHRMLYVSQVFQTSDTAAMRDSILSLYASFHPSTGIAALPAAVSAFSVYPNPASDVVSVKLGMKENANVSIEMMDVTGKLVSTLLSERQNAGVVNKSFNTTSLPDGNYLIKLTVNGQSSTQKVSITH